MASRGNASSIDLWPLATSAEAAPPAAIATAGHCVGSGGAFALEGEHGTGDGSVKLRGVASNQETVWLHDGESRTLTLDLDATAKYEVLVRYSNDGPPDTVQVSIDDTVIGQCTTQDTRPPGGVPGSGWNEFFSCEPLGPVILSPGQHELTVLAETDFYGVQVDVVSLKPVPVERPLEVGTATVYGVGSSIVHAPDDAIAALWEAENLSLLHPRFGSADAFNLDIADAVISGCVHQDEPRVLRTAGPWANMTGFGIDHGPMLILIDNHLGDQLSPIMFMSHPAICAALGRTFPLLDSDGDGSVDACDSCPDTPNGEQENNVHPLTPDGDHCEDPDDDTFFDIDDNCPDTPNPVQEDDDSDGLGNVCDPCSAISDCDGDAFSDYIEVHVGSDSLDACADTATANDEDPPDAWPVDFNDDQRAAMQDAIFAFVTTLQPYGGLNVPVATDPRFCSASTSR